MLYYYLTDLHNSHLVLSGAQGDLFFTHFHFIILNILRKSLNKTYPVLLLVMKSVLSE